MSLPSSNEYVLVQVPQSDWNSVVKALHELNNSVDSLTNAVSQHFQVIRDGLLGDTVKVIRDDAKQKEIINSDSTVTTDATATTTQVSIAKTMDELSVEEFDNIMDEIDDDIKRNKYLSKLSFAEQTFINETFSKYRHRNITNDLKATLTKSFIGESFDMNRKFGDYWVQKIYLEDLISGKDEQDKHLANIWNDYIAINCNFIHKELKESLLVLTNNNVEDVEYLYKKWFYRRNMCGYLPIKYHERGGMDGWKDYIKMTEYFEEKDKSHPLALFCMIYSGIANIFFKWNENTETIGLDGYLYYYYYSSKNVKRVLSEKENKKSFADICLDYFLDIIVQTGIFGYFLTDFKSIDVTEDEKKQEFTKRDIAMKKMLEILFRNDKTHLLKLMEYCIQDIKCDNNENIVDRYDANTRNKEERIIQVDEPTTQLGIVFYVINRLSYVVFHDLIIFKSKSKNKSSQVSQFSESSMFYPELVKLYQFLYNFCVWNECYPQIDDNSGRYEALYIKRYYTLRDTIYKNVFHKDEVEPLEKNVQQPLLKYFGLYDTFNYEGTILHCTATYDMRYYTQILVNDDFPFDIYNRRAKTKSRTAMDIARKQNSFAIENIFKAKQEQMNQDDSKTDDPQGKNNSVSLTNKSIENKYYNYLNQLMSAKYHLMVLGSPVANESCIPDHKVLKIDEAEEEMVNVLHDDDLYCNFDAFDGLRGLKNKLFEDSKDCRLCLNNLVYGMIALLNKKMAISQDMLVFCWQYCIELEKEKAKDKEKDNEENSELVDKFIQALNNVTRECLGSNDEEKEKTSDKDGPEEIHKLNKLLKSRNYQWFKENLLHSNIWLSEYTEKNDKRDKNKQHHVLYEYLVTVVNKELTKQKQFIWDSFKNEEKRNNKDYEKLLCFGDAFTFKSKLGKEYALSRSRQDKISHGIIPGKKELDLILMTVEMDKDSKKSSSTTDQFNIMFESNTKTYLTDCLSYAHVNNARLQKIAQKVFGTHSSRYRRALVDGKNCQYQAAPVKTYERCVIKATQDYGTRNFPSAACILDFLRFSVTFNTVSDLLVGLKDWVKAIKDNKIECFGPNSIVRVKNGFSDVKNWKSFKDASYCDIKFNLIYSNGKENDKEQQMIVEAQFLVKFLLKAKKMGHKLYSVIRQSDYINTICNELYDIDGNYNKYKQKINKMIETNDSSNFIRQLFVRPNSVLSMITFEIGKRFIPLLRIIGFSGNDKLFALYLSCLFHFSLIILNEDNNKNNKFLRKYFNFNELHDTIGSGRYLWGISSHDVNGKSFDNIKYKHIELIMSLPYFDGIDQRMRKNGYDIRRDVQKLFQDYHFEMLSLLLKYFDKNKLLIKKGLPRITMEDHLLPNAYDSWVVTEKDRQRMKLFFDMYDKCGLVVGKKNLEQGIAYLERLKKKKSYDKDQLLRKIVQSYYDKHYPTESKSNE